VKLAIGIAIACMFATPGIRLLRLRLSNRAGPEGWLSVFFLGLAIGAPLRLQLAGASDVSAEWMRILSGVAVVALTTSAASLTGFTWRVFRPDSGIAKLWSGLTICVFCAACLGLFVTGQTANQTHPLSMLANAWAISAFAWTFFECVNYYTRMRRQAQIGLGDPVVQNRFLLWSIWTGSLVALPIVILAVKVMLLADTAPGEQVMAPVGVMTFVRAVVLICSSSMLVSIWLSFFAPQAYLVRIRGEASA
jgi:hypothetical protein